MAFVVCNQYSTPGSPNVRPNGHRLTISGQEKSREMYEECHKIKVGENEYRQIKNVSFMLPVHFL